MIISLIFFILLLGWENHNFVNSKELLSQQPTMKTKYMINYFLLSKKSKQIKKDTPEFSQNLNDLDYYNII